MNRGAPALGRGRSTSFNGAALGGQSGVRLQRTRASASYTMKLPVALYARTHNVWDGGRPRGPPGAARSA
jgi:hypothetical protein